MSDPNPAYLLIGTTQYREPDAEETQARLKYQKLGGAALARLGVTIEMVARGSVAADSNVPEPKMEVLEGAYPFGGLAIEGFPSMEGLEAFWNSPEYQEAIQIRQPFKSREMHFVAALEGATTEASGAPPAEGPLAYSITCPPVVADAGSYDLQRYREIAGSIDRGYKPQLIAQAARDELKILEGNWPFPAGVIIKAHPSVQSMIDFWQNPTYIEARAHRPELAMQAVIPGFVMPEQPNG